MTEPLVCCVMLTRDRPQLAARAVRCFREQTYRKKTLLIWDAGAELLINHPAWDAIPAVEEDFQIAHVPVARIGNPSVGQLRNSANAFWTEYPILIHWDDDDWSHPNRIAEQVALLQSSKAPAVGYSSLPWWDSVKREAWLYKSGNSRYCLGTSMCYWRTTWERNKFTDPAGEWNHGEGVRQLGVPMQLPVEWPEIGSGDVTTRLPMIIAEYHGGNGHCKIAPPHPVTGSRLSPEWKRKPEWDARFAEIMAL